MSNSDSLSFAPDTLVRGGTVTTADGVKQSLTTAGAADHIAAYGWGPAGASATVTYAFRATGTDPDSGSSGFTLFNANQIAAAGKALSAWADVANIHFTRVDDGNGYSDNATILFGDFNDGPEAGFTYMPGSRAASSVRGDVWINGSLSYNQAPALYNYGDQVIAHEIGHSIGLSHPSDYDASDATEPTYAANASYYEDSRQYTIMSYFGSFNTGAYLTAYAPVPLIDDITAAQRLYGANMATRTDDTVYGFHSNAGRDWFSISDASVSPIFSVWDAGGNDTFDFSGYSQNQKIDLRAGDFSDVGAFRSNVSIAYGVTIDNAIGGSGDDIVIGNQAANHLQGGTGGDTMSGEAGNDLVEGGAGNDRLDGGSGSDTLDGGDGNDQLLGPPGIGPAGGAFEADYYFGGSGADTVTGGPGNDHIYGYSPTVIAGTVDGADSLTGGGGSDYIQGNAGADTIDGGDGSDRLYGGADADSVFGGIGNDYLQGNKGNDSLSGSDGDDTLRGGADNDQLSGDAGNDQLFGDVGDDWIAGGAGLDMLSGGAGNDLFAFAAGDAGFATSGAAAYATDQILDLGIGADHVSLSFHVVAVLHGSAASTAVAAALAASLLAQGGVADVAAISVGADTYLFYGPGGGVTEAIDLVGQSTGAITTSLFT